MVSWQLILGLSLLVNSFSILFEKKIHNVKESNPIAFAILFQFLIGIVFLFFGILSGQLRFDGLLKVWPNILILTVFYGFGDIFLFRALKMTQASIFTIFFNSSAIFTIVSSSFFLRQFLNFYQILGVFLILTSIVILNWSKNRIVFDKGLLFTIIGAMLFGFNVSNDKYLLNHINTITFLSVGFLFPAVLMIFVYRKQLKDIGFFFKPKILPDFSVFCAFYLFQALFYYIALKLSNNSSQVAGISLFGNILTVLVCMVFLKETDRFFTKIIASLISFLGLILIG